jgi:hypothetical protein
VAVTHLMSGNFRREFSEISALKKAVQLANSEKIVNRAIFLFL